MVQSNLIQKNKIDKYTMVKHDDSFKHNAIYVGMNAIENVQIIKKARQKDMWFHLEDYPSCHVIIENTKRHPITNEMIIHCAILCKQHSKYKDQRGVGINYCPVKNLIVIGTSGTVEIVGDVERIVV
jgi:predicted ribosome quality control (RQC) complex YloA/Tae2 family protein